MIFNPALPFRQVLVIQGHKDGILSCLAHCVQLLQQKFDKLLLVFCWNHRQAIDNHKGI